MKLLARLPHTGEIISDYSSYVGLVLLFIIVSYLVWRKNNKKK
ncbi:LPXTG cell wall anchor domain-containing protein [Gemella sp. zg-1178]|nr:LPXTG cell wall anchor domain-containing protein [Gemella sp. zg-1178]MBU0278898.1 LPXTG cell wall anchor domain-containing protein [Gemella sp. zg-1178]